MENADEFDFSFKIAVGGVANVGKTNVVHRFVHDAFRDDARPTLGIDFVVKDVEVGDKVVRCQIWDTAGQERLNAIAKMFYRNVNGIVLVFDITDRDSFEALGYWFEEMRDNTPENTPSIVLGNKADLHSDRKVTFEEAAAMTKSRGSFYAEVSAKDNPNNGIQEALVYLLKELVTRIQSGVDLTFRQESRGTRSSTLLRLQEARRPQKRGSCC
jgi:small GTP-binding protein